MESCEDQDSREKVMSAITRIEGAEGRVAEVNIKDLVDKMIQEEVAAAEASFIKEQVCLGKNEWESERLIICLCTYERMSTVDICIHVEPMFILNILDIYNFAT